MRLAGLLLLLAVRLAPAAQSVTFSENVAPIVYSRCTSCHRPGEAAPFSLISFEDVSKRGKLIAAVTASRYMPPWKAEPASYHYRDDRRLTDAELQTIQTWVKEGMPQGDPKKTPALPKFQDGWQLGTPDVVVKMEKGFTVPAEGTDIYRYERIPLNLPEDRWVPGNRVAAILEESGSPRSVLCGLHRLREKGASRSGCRNEAGCRNEIHRQYGSARRVAVGAQPHLLPEGLALKLPKGTDLMFQYHFHPTGKAETEQSTIGLYFAKKAPERMLTAIQLPVTYGLFSGMNIAPGEKSFTVRDSFVLPVDVDAVSVGAHAHYIGKTMKMTATLPDGTAKTPARHQGLGFRMAGPLLLRSVCCVAKGHEAR